MEHGSDDLVANLDLLKDLDEFDPDLPAPTENEELRPPTDEDDARKMLRWLRGVRREKKHIAEVAGNEIVRITAWAQDRTAGLDSRAASLERALEGWTRAHLAGQKRRSVSTPYGTLKLTAPRSSIEVVDDEAFVAWAEENQRLDLLKLTASKTAVADAIKNGTLAASATTENSETATLTTLVAESGEAIPGVRLATPKQDSFSVSPST